LEKFNIVQHILLLSNTVQYSSKQLNIVKIAEFRLIKLNAVQYSILQWNPV